MLVLYNSVQSSLSLPLLQSDGYNILNTHKKIGWKIHALPFIAIKNVGLMSCEMMMSCVGFAGYCSVWLVLPSLLFHQKFAY